MEGGGPHSKPLSGTKLVLISGNHSEFQPATAGGRSGQDEGHQADQTPSPLICAISSTVAKAKAATEANEAFTNKRHKRILQDIKSEHTKSCVLIRTEKFGE